MSSKLWSLRVSPKLAVVLLVAVIAAPELYGQSGVTFASPILIPTNPYNAAVASGDFNNDKIQDLVVAPEKNGYVSVGLGNGNGTFSPWLDTLEGGLPSLLAVGKFDGINLDAVINDGQGNNASVLLGEGTGFFPNSAFLDIGGVYAGGFAVADFNGDRKLDLAVAAEPFSGSGSVYVFLGNGDGTFAPPIIADMGGAFPGLMVTGDFNGDHIPDIAVLNYGVPNGSSGNLAVLLGRGDGTFQPPKVTHTPKNPIVFGSSIAAGDFNGDGKLDLAVTSYTPRGVLAVLLGQGDGTFKRGAIINAGPGLGSVAVADFNGDGKLDLVVAGSDQKNNGYIAIIPGNGDGTFQPRSIFPLNGKGPEQITVADFNNDGKPDVATANVLSSNVSLMLNTSQY